MSAFTNSHWTIDQVIAWVCLRHRAFNGEIVSVDDDGRASATRLCEVASSIGLLTCEQAKRSILEALRDGHLHAWGVRNDSGDHEEITASAWLGLDLFFGRTDFDFEAGPKDPNRAGTRWYQLRFKRNEVKTIWDPTGSIEATLAAVTGVISGTVANPPPVRGMLAGTLPSLTGTLVGEAAEPGLPPSQANACRKINAVVAAAHTRWPENQPPIREMARVLADKAQSPELGSDRLAFGPIKEILSGTYPPMLTHRIAPPFPRLVRAKRS